MFEIFGWKVDTTSERLLAATALVIGILLVSRVLQAVTVRRIDTADRRYRVRKLVSFAAYGAALVGGVAVLRDSLGGLTVAIGVAGAGIAFALQEVIASIAGWFAISFAGFYRTGDRVQLGGIKGDVIDIGLLRTTLMEIGEWVNSDLYNGRVVRVANSFVFKEPVFNYSGDFPFLWDEIWLPIRYGTDWELARQLLYKVAEEVVGESTVKAGAALKESLRQYVLTEVSVEPLVTLKPTDNWIELRLRYVVDYRARRRTQDRLFARFLEEVDKTDGKVGFASATLQVIPGSAIDVRMRP
ncbi:MAG: mechanosensitive ion channel [Dehalococcoidia bacterium]|nr:mechanosensitive ion channel family protein [Dehalococcoidia bacterium]MCB9485272.1 mechanosensitive ion channel family protein [Thermoflexaceae bacterium]